MNHVESIITALTHLSLTDRDEQIYCGQQIGPILPEIKDLLVGQRQAIEDLTNVVEAKNGNIANLTARLDMVTKERDEALRRILTLREIIGSAERLAGELDRGLNEAIKKDLAIFAVKA